MQDDLRDDLVNDIEVEGCAAFSLEMESGARVASSVTLGSARDVSCLRFCYEGLTAEGAFLPYAPADGLWTFLACAPNEQADVDRVLDGISDITPNSLSGYAGFFEAAFDAIDGRAGSEVTIKDARRSIVRPVANSR